MMKRKKSKFSLLKIFSSVILFVRERNMPQAQTMTLDEKGYWV